MHISKAGLKVAEVNNPYISSKVCWEHNNLDNLSDPNLMQGWLE